MSCLPLPIHQLLWLSPQYRLEIAQTECRYHLSSDNCAYTLWHTVFIIAKYYKPAVEPTDFSDCPCRLIFRNALAAVLS